MPRPPLCDAYGCGESADYLLVGRWTIFDWLEKHVCLVHFPKGVRALQESTIDGEPPEYIEQIAYER